MSSSEEGTSDEHFMKEALKTAALAFDAGEVPVGCVIVSDGKIVGRAHNDTNATLNATRHAEFVAIESLPADMADLSSCTLFVTIEPCVMCASALHQLKLSRCVFGAPNAKFGGCGSVFDIPGDAGEAASFSVKAGVLAQEAIQLLRVFYERGNAKAPKPHRRVAKNELPPVVVGMMAQESDA